MINWGAASSLSQQRRARQQWFTDGVQSFASHDDEGEDEVHEPLGHPLAAPRPTLGAAPPPRQAYGFRPAATFQHGALGHTAPVVVGTRPAPNESV